MAGRRHLFTLLIYLGWCHLCSGGPKAYFSDLKCTTFNKLFATIDACRIRAVRRGISEVSIKIKVHQLPVDNVTVRMQFMKKSNGYKPYLMDVTFDGCKFMRERDNPLLRYLFEYLRPYTNVNHSCPYNHDVSVESLRIDQSLLSLAPMPSGDYAFFTTWMSNNIKRIYLQLYFKFEEM